MRIPSLKLTANAPGNMTIGIDTRFLLGPGLFSGAIAVSFRECTICLNLMYDRSITSFHPIIPYRWIYVQHCVLSRGALTNNSPSYSCCLFLRLRLKTLPWKMYMLRKIIFWSQNGGTVFAYLKNYIFPKTRSRSSTSAIWFLGVLFQKKRWRVCLKEKTPQVLGGNFGSSQIDLRGILGLKIPKASETWDLPPSYSRKTAQIFYFPVEFREFSRKHVSLHLVFDTLPSFKPWGFPTGIVWITAWVQ